MKILGKASQQEIQRLSKLFTKPTKAPRNKKQQQPLVFRRISIYQMLTLKQRQLIVHLFTQRNWTKREISNKLNVKIPTVYSVIDKFERDGEVKLHNCNSGRRPTQRI
jgi:DNA-binding MarR family transcriptional regulator